nr:8762_t:CDS:2 [Entrophospora candida]CAG8438705.1 3851_t:CDS:2 [Entrophospora candida]
MQEYNNKAAEIIFLENNKDRPITELDLHGLFVKEAVEKTKLRIEQCELKGVSYLVIIVGKGKHSINGISKLRPAVLELIKKHNLRCTPNKPTDGCLHVEIGSPDGASQDLNWFQSLFGIKDNNSCIIC